MISSRITNGMKEAGTVGKEHLPSVQQITL
jgi:hypothetical protein